LFAALGAGGLIGTALAGRVSRRLESRSVLAAALAAAGAPMLLLAVVRWPAAAIVLTGLTGMGALLVEILTETTLQRELDEDVFGRAYGIAFPAAIAGIVVGSVIAPGLAALLGASGALIAVGGTVLGYALLVIRGADDAPADPASQPAMADAVPAR
jgi:predicted MFS family arabinose efflux permease